MKTSNDRAVRNRIACTILDGMLVQKALVLQAEKDSIPVTEEEIEAEIDQKIRYFISQYGSKEALEQIAGTYHLPDAG